MFGDIPISQQPDNEANIEGIILRGLEPLTTLKQVFIYREKFTAWEDDFSNKHRTQYSIVDNTGRLILIAIETSYLCGRNFCSDLRTFDISICESGGHEEVLKFRRPFRGDCCYCPFLMQNLEVITPQNNEMLGRITQSWAVCRPKFGIQLPTGEILFRVLGSCCTMRCCVRELNFGVWSRNSLLKIATISRQWNGVLSAGYEDTEFFGICFHQEVDIIMKALIIGASFLINALYYQT